MNTKQRQKDTRHPSLILAAIILVVVGMFACFYGFRTTKTVTLSYDDSASKIDYQVCNLGEDLPLVDTCAESDVYNSYLIEYLLADYDYIADFSMPISGDLSYQLVATVTATENDATGSYKFGSREYPLTEVKTRSLSSASTLNIKESVNVDYDYYAQVMDDFRKLSATVDGSLTVELRIDGEITTPELAEYVDFDSSLHLELPLTSEEVKVTAAIGDAENANKSYSAVVSTDNIIKFIARCLTLVSFVGALILAHLTYLSYHKYNTAHYYEYSVRKILGAYDGIIVDLRRPLDLKGYKVNDVTEFDELLDAYHVTHQPINFYQQGNASHFVVMDEKHAWRYTLRASDYKIKHKLTKKC